MSLSMLFELILDQHAHAKVEIINNSDSALDDPFLPEGMEVPIIKAENWSPTSEEIYLLGVNLPKTKKIVFEYFHRQFDISPQNYGQLIHSSSIFGRTSQSGPGLVMHPLSVVSAQTQLGKMVSLNRGTTVGHHTRIGDYCTLHPAANVAGRCRIGSGVTLGMGANVIDGIHIGSGTFVGAGAVVTRNLPPGVVAYGQPAKVIKEIDNNPFHGT